MLKLYYSLISSKSVSKFNLNLTMTHLTDKKSDAPLFTESNIHEF